MEWRNLGRSGLRVPVLCLGTMIMGDQLDEEVSIQLVRHAMDKGLSFFDTAEVYNKGLSELWLGTALKGCRDKVIIATKVRQPMEASLGDIDLSRKHVVEAVEGSLRRLQTEDIDLYQAHRFDARTPLEETLRALDDLVRSGKVRYVGCSNFTAWQLCKALWTSDKRNLVRFDSLQPMYNLALRMAEVELFPLCLEEGIGVLVYNPLGGGFLTGKYTDATHIPANTRFALKAFYGERYLTAENFRRLDKVRKLAREAGRSVVEMALGWLLSQRVVTSAIVGASSVKQLDQNLAAAEARLSQEEMKALEALWPPQRTPVPPGVNPWHYPHEHMV